jgi:hypothetical protein
MFHCSDKGDMSVSQKKRLFLNWKEFSSSGQKSFHPGNFSTSTRQRTFVADSNDLIAIGKSLDTRARKPMLALVTDMFTAPEWQENLDPQYKESSETDSCISIDSRNKGMATLGSSDMTVRQARLFKISAH